MLERKIVVWKQEMSRGKDKRDVVQCGEVNWEPVWRESGVPQTLREANALSEKNQSQKKNP